MPNEANIKATVTRYPCVKVEHKNWNRPKLMFRWLIPTRKLYTGFYARDRMKKTHGGDGEVTPVSTGTTFAGPVLLTQLAVTLVNFKGCCRQGNPEEQETGGSRAPEESSPGKVVHPENTSLSKETKKIRRKGRSLARVALHLSKRESRPRKHISWSPPRYHTLSPPPCALCDLGHLWGKQKRWAAGNSLGRSLPPHGSILDGSFWREEISRTAVSIEFLQEKKRLQGGGPT